MGDIDVAICEYIAENGRVADLFNGLYFQGERRIHAENIEDYEEKYPVKYQTGGKRSKHTGKVRYRDIVKKLKSGGSLRILAMENQNQVDYTMPFRCMEYDTLEYRRQIDHRIRENEKNPQWSNKAAERLCGVRKTDRFAPVYTVCLYHGKEAWDGPRSLKDMMDFGSDSDQMSRYFADYPMKLFCVNEEQDFSCFHTELRQFFTMISSRKDWKRLRRLAESEDYRNLSADTAEAIAVVLGWSDPKEIQMKYEEKGKGVNMCKALEDLLTIEREKGEKLGIEQGIERGIEQGIERGIAQGIERGIEQNAYNMIWNMQEEGIELDRICRISGKTAEEVQRILESKS